VTLIHKPIETARLILRPETPADGEAIHRMNTDPEVMRHIGDGIPWTSPVEEFLPQHRQALARAAAERYGNVSVVLRESGEYIGWCGLTPEKRIGGMQLGYRFFRHAWNRGYATEAAGAVLAVGFESLGLDRICAAVFPDNLASVRVLEKVGMKPAGQGFHEKAQRHFHIYAIECPAPTGRGRPSSMPESEDRVLTGGRPEGDTTGNAG
jgi:ribosomal-protein-alanine N-acetyltransferase